MKEYIAEYIVPVEKEGNDQMFDFMNAKRLIRCKDCFWYRSVELKADGTHDRRFKPTRCGLWEQDMYDDDFCSYATEKKDEKEKENSD